MKNTIDDADYFINRSFLLLFFKRLRMPVTPTPSSTSKYFFQKVTNRQNGSTYQYTYDAIARITLLQRDATITNFHYYSANQLTLVDHSGSTHPLLIGWEQCILKERDVS